MDLIQMGSGRVCEGLEAMLEACGEHMDIAGFVEVERALLILEIAKRAPDRENWFPCGKWGTIQALERRVEREIDTVKFE